MWRELESNDPKNFDSERWGHYHYMDVYGRTLGGMYVLSDDLFRCRVCKEVKDKDEKNQITGTKWSTKATAKGALCDSCFTKVVGKMSEAGFTFGEWKAWPQRKKDSE